MQNKPKTYLKNSIKSGSLKRGRGEAVSEPDYNLNNKF